MKTQTLPKIDIIVRLGADIVIKSRAVRAWFIERLVQNIKAALDRQGIDNRVENNWNHLRVAVNDPRALITLKHVFGISSFSVIEHRCASDLNDIVRTGSAAYQNDIKNKTFAIRAQRSGEFPFTSVDINRELGSALNPYAAKVDLRNPEFTVHVHIHPQETYFYVNKIAGAGGLPQGVNGHALCLFSGGFDSPVAAWMMLKRGVRLDYLFCDFGGQTYKRDVLAVGKLLAEYWHHGTTANLHIIDFKLLVEEIKKNVESRVAQVVLKRLFYRAAEIVAHKIGVKALVTGEALGQVSSQTLHNFQTIEDVTALPVLRPLAGMDKQDIINLSRTVGTHDLSATIKEHCQISKDRAHAACPLELAEREEQKISLDLIEKLAKGYYTISLKKLTDDDIAAPNVLIDHIPDKATLIDCRDKELFAQWHYKDAKHVELGQLMKEFTRYDKTAPYVLYCPFGTQSAIAAEEMRRNGFEAYSFKGGSMALRRIEPDTQIHSATKG